MPMPSSDQTTFCLVFCTLGAVTLAAESSWMFTQGGILQDVMRRSCRESTLESVSWHHISSRCSWTFGWSENATISSSESNIPSPVKWWYVLWPRGTDRSWRSSQKFLNNLPRFRLDLLEFASPLMNRMELGYFRSRSSMVIFNLASSAKGRHH